MLDQILKDLKNEVKFGYLKKKHAFRYPSLASIYQDKPVQRTVVLRDTTEDFDIIMYTDERSDKVSHFKKNSEASLLFYNHKKLLQVQIQGHMELIDSGEVYEDYWSKVQGNSQNDFITKNPPGTPLSNPDHVEYKDDEHHFCLLKLVPERMEYLQLSRPNHIRASFDKSKNWEGQFLNP